VYVNQPEDLVERYTETDKRQACCSMPGSCQQCPCTLSWSWTSGQQ